MERGVGGQPHKTQHFNSRHRCTHTWNDPPKKGLGPAQLPPHRCRTFPLLPVQWGLASSEACECGAEQTVDHVVLHCPIYQPPHGLHVLTFLDDETTEWLLNTSLDILAG